MQRGDVYLADLSPIVGSEQGGRRQVLLVQNQTADTLVVAVMGNRVINAGSIINVLVRSESSGLIYDSAVLIEQLYIIKKDKIMDKIGELDDETLKEVSEALKQVIA